jgi:hypothetical protein
LVTHCIDDIFSTPVMRRWPTSTSMRQASPPILTAGSVPTALGCSVPSASSAACSAWIA